MYMLIYAIYDGSVNGQKKWDCGITVRVMISRLKNRESKTFKCLKAFRTIPPCDRYDEPAHCVLMTGTWYMWISVLMHVNILFHACMCTCTHTCNTYMLTNKHTHVCVHTCFTCISAWYTYWTIRAYITGTPLQNNTEELWCLLHFLDPINYSNIEVCLSTSRSSSTYV
jgi:hypothetical protein